MTLYIWGICFSFSAKSEEACNSELEECVEDGKVNLSLLVGLGIRTNPLNQSDNLPLLVLPQISYYKNDFFIENLDLGYNLHSDKSKSLALVASPSFDSVFFNRWDPGNILIDLSFTGGLGVGSNTTELDQLTEINPNELSKRKFSYLAGLEYSQNFKDAYFQVSYLTDISNIHQGNEIRFAFAYALSQKFTTTLGLTWKDKKIADYYYGVNPEEIVDDRGAYQVEASLNPFVRLSYQSNSGQDNNWIVRFEYQKLDKNIYNSPILEEEKTITLFVGKNFTIH